MNILPIHTPVIKKGDDFSSILSHNTEIIDGDIIVISSKAIATAEGAAIDLSTLPLSDDAKKWSADSGLSAAFCEAVIQETQRLHGRIMGSAPKALLTEVIPDGLTQGVMLVPNAGLDQSNIEKGFAIGWPIDPVTSAKKIYDEIRIKHEIRNTKYETNSKLESENLNKENTLGFRISDFGFPTIAIIIGDSCIQPRRWGVTAFALVTCGIDPLHSMIGEPDLFGRPLSITVEAVADQLAVAANTVMGNAGQSNPAAIIRDHRFAFSTFNGWVPGMKPEEDLFRGIL